MPLTYEQLWQRVEELERVKCSLEKRINQLTERTYIMPCNCQPTGTCPPPGGSILFECCDRLKVRAEICEAPTDCYPATWPVGLQLTILEWPDMGAGSGDWVSAFRIVDCAHGGVNRVELMTAWEGVVRQGLGAVVNDVPGAVGVIGAVDGRDDATGYLGYVDPSGNYYAVRSNGNLQLLGDLVSEDGTVLIQGSGSGSVVGGGSSSGGSSSGGVSGDEAGGSLTLSGTTLTLMAVDGTTSLGSVTLPSGGGTSGLTSVATDVTLSGNGTSGSPLGIASGIDDVVWTPGPANLGGSYTNYPTAYYIEQAPSGAGDASSVIELLDPSPGAKRRISFLSRNTESGGHFRPCIWTQAPKVEGAAAGQFNLGDAGSYYENSDSGTADACSCTLSCYVGGVAYAMRAIGTVALFSGDGGYGTAIGWPDAVFEQDYELMPIEEHRAYTTQTKSLPGLPSEEDVETAGMNLGHLLPQLLLALEEAYLYIYDLHDRVMQLEMA